MSQFCRRLIPGLLLSLAAFAGLAVEGENTAPDPNLLHTDSVLAVVGDYLITTHDVTSTTRMGEAFLAMKYRDQPAAPDSVEALETELLDYRHQVAGDLLNQTIIYNEFKRRGFVLPEGIVKERLAQTVDRRADGNSEKFEQWLAARNTTLEDYKDRLRRSIAVELLVAREVDQQIVIAPREIQTYYENHRDQFRIPGKITMQLLSIQTEGVDPAVVDEKLSAILAALEKGIPFDQIVLEHSDGFNRQQGGLLPELEFSKMNEDYRKAVAGLKPGQVSKPFPQKGMLNFLYVKELVPGERLSLDKVRGKIEMILKRRERAWRYRDFVRRLRQRSYTRIYFKEE